MGDGVFQGHPDERGDEKSGVVQAAAQESEDPAKKRPEGGQQQHQQGIDEQAEDDRHMAVVGRNVGDPVQQDRVKDCSRDSAQQQPLAGTGLGQKEEEGNERDPGEEHEIELGKGDGGQGPGGRRPQDGNQRKLFTHGFSCPNGK